MKPAGILLLMSLWMTSSFAEVNLNQDERGYRCRWKIDSSSKVEALLIIDRRDREMSIQWPNGNKEEFQSQKFLGQGVIFQNEKRAALFHVLEDGRVSVLVGQKWEMSERDCEDTGASKTCQNSSLQELFWSSEDLRIKTSKETWTAKVTRYGVFQKGASYFYADEKKRRLALIDFGATFSVFAGELASPHCSPYSI